MRHHSQDKSDNLPWYMLDESPCETFLFEEASQLAQVCTQWVSLTRHQSQEKSYNSPGYMLNKSTSETLLLGGVRPLASVHAQWISPVRHHSQGSQIAYSDTCSMSLPDETPLLEKLGNLPGYVLDEHSWENKITCPGKCSMSLPNETSVSGKPDNLPGYMLSDHPQGSQTTYLGTCLMSLVNETTLRQVGQVAQVCVWWPLLGNSDNFPGNCLMWHLGIGSQFVQVSVSWDNILSYMSIQGKPDNFSGNHFHLFLNSVHKYTGIYDDTSLLAFKEIMMLAMGVYSLSISFWTVFTNTQTFMMV